MKNTEQPGAPRLSYTIFCDDVRLELGNKFSLMGVFREIVVPHFPVTVIRFAIVSQWRGEGRHLSEVRITTEDRQRLLALGDPSPFELTPGGVSHNFSVFLNVVFPAPGRYWVQTLIDSSLADEQELTLIRVDAAGAPVPDDSSEAVN